MTCIAAIRTTDSIIMGGDSAFSSASICKVGASPKVFIVDDYIFGVSGPVRVLQQLRYKFNPPCKTQGANWPEFMATVFIGAIEKQLDIFNNDFAALVGTKGGGIFHLDRGFGISQFRDGFDACGCGSSFALGVLHSSDGNPRERVQAALEAAAYFDSLVRPPFTILELPEEGLIERLPGTFEPFEDRSALFASDPDDQGNNDADLHTSDDQRGFGLP